jgi:hypothetical protein
MFDPALSGLASGGQLFGSCRKVQLRLFEARFSRLQPELLARALGLGLWACPSDALHRERRSGPRNEKTRHERRAEMEGGLQNPFAFVNRLLDARGRFAGMRRIWAIFGGLCLSWAPFMGCGPLARARFGVQVRERIDP